MVVLLCFSINIFYSTKISPIQLQKPMISSLVSRGFLKKNYTMKSLPVIILHERPILGCNSKLWIWKYRDDGMIVLHHLIKVLLSQCTHHVAPRANLMHSCSVFLKVWIKRKQSATVKAELKSEICAPSAPRYNKIRIMKFSEKSKAARRYAQRT